ncbi:DUF6626 family protein [Oceanomicrobium pacificus]|uniref:Uncharacterized protein n=1 Tax=Oceanomicrobium pacificus TaxID=2692916 RepID=A0A6B0TML7_9RHOB|nr:DUF6626 family protein [Oceanomicrobium pacificus]MXU63809.1 hypothetical protein [Oceanomicrobium pacificus]
MTLMEEVYDQLAKNAFVETAEEFSTDWCWRSRSWFSVQKNKKSDFSIPVAINCLNKVKVQIAMMHIRKQKLGGIAESDLGVLQDVRAKLERHLLEQHRVAAVAEPDDARPENVS